MYKTSTSRGVHKQSKNFKDRDTVRSVSSRLAQSEMGPPQPDVSSVEDVDYVLVGAGLSGIFLVAEGLQQGFKSIVVLDKKDRIGGLWADLPAWQTIQNRPSDFTMQGFTTRKKVWYAKDVLHMLDEYVRVQSLERYIRLNTDVVGHEWSDAQDRWILTTKSSKEGVEAGCKKYRCKVLILATGRHATPLIPPIPTDGSVPMLHSSQIHKWQDFKGKRVAVLGAGASGLDMLINTLQLNEDRPELKVAWVLREPKYFTGGEGDADMLKITAGQLVSRTGVEAITAGQWALDLTYRSRFVRAGVADWFPKKRLNIHTTQIVPGRSYLLKKENIRRIDRHCGTEISEMRDGYLYLSNGQVIGPFDHLLLGTGYDRPKHPKGTSELLESVRDKLLFKTWVPGKYTGRLILAGEELLDGIGAGPFSAHVLARSLWALMRADAEGKAETTGTARFKRKPERYVLPTERANHLQLLIFGEAVGKPGILTPYLWRSRMWHTYLYYRFRYNTTCLFGDRVLGKNMSLDTEEDKLDHPLRL